jgi:hypothetical protein
MLKSRRVEAHHLLLSLREQAHWEKGGGLFAASSQSGGNKPSGETGTPSLTIQPESSTTSCVV